jgi:hypothetical protein
MEYKGKLYGKVGEIVFPLLHTTDDWEKMENRIAQLEAENQALRQPPVIGSVCRCKKCGCEIRVDVGDSLCAECWSAN